MKRFGLIGQSLKHSFSPSYFTKKFSEQGLADHIYQAFEISDISEFPALLKNYPDLAGLNVTLPYKSEVIQFLDAKNELVEKSGACNCIKISDGKLTGFNTDIPGFRSSLKPYLKPWHTNALVLGTGGASRAVKYVLEELKISYKTVSRDHLKADLVYNNLNEAMMQEYTLIINTTPLGTSPDIAACPPIPYEFITEKHLCFDLIYNPPQTEFLKRAKLKGASIINGFEMLVVQAEESWNIWQLP
jgi:shikimate dehydrogenase